MKWLPYHRFELISPLRAQDALAAIGKHIEPMQWFRWRWPSQTNDDRFEGEITGSGFNLRRIMGYRNSFAPSVAGEVHSQGALSRIVVTMRPHVFVIVFMAIWCAAVGSTVVIPGSDPWFGILMVAAAYLMTMGGFWFEAAKQERTLRAIFMAT